MPRWLLSPHFCPRSSRRSDTLTRLPSYSQYHPMLSHLSSSQSPLGYPTASSSADFSSSSQARWAEPDIVVHNNHVRYFATFCIVSGTYTTIGLVIAWYAHNLGSETKRATGTPLYMAIGQCGSILGSHLFPTAEGPRYIKGFSVLVGLLFLGSICASALTTHYRYENTRRNRVYGKHVPNTRVDTSELADRAPGFRYIV